MTLVWAPQLAPGWGQALCANSAMDLVESPPWYDRDA
jgi:hypothetical protein